MKKAFTIIIVMIIFLSYVQPLHAKTTFDVSFRTRSLTVSDDKAQDFGIFMSEWLSPQIMPIIEMELMNDTLDVLIRVMNYNIIEIILRDSDGDGAADILEYIGQTLSDALLADDDILINPIMSAVKNTFLDDTVGAIYGDGILGGILNAVIPRNTMRGFIENIYNNFEGTLEDLLKDFIANDLVGIINEHVADLISDVPGLLEDLILEEMPSVLSDLVADEIPGLIEDLIADYLPRDIDLYILSLDFKTDITPLLALGASIRGTGFDTLFIPEISLALYFKLIDNANFNWSLMVNGQNIFTPGSLDNITALNFGTSFAWQPVKKLVIDGEISLGKFIGKPLRDETPNIIWNYSLGLSYNITNNAHIKVSYSLNGLTNLAVTYLERLLTGKENYGWLNFSAGFQF